LGREQAGPAEKVQDEKYREDCLLRHNGLQNTHFHVPL
jgi:hypothetical protein